jgi:NAD(P)-dependent dehydrogenase (short-subunit alcohol dehydrogenase family)
MIDCAVMRTDLFSLDRKTALVTGGARGVGLMCAEALLDHGASVIITTRKEGPGEAARVRLAERGPCELIVADLSTPEGIAGLAVSMSERHAALDILVNNAGANWGASLEDYPAHAWTKVLQLNVATPFQVVQQLLPLLEAASTPENPARIVNIGSIDGHSAGSYDNYAYGASKGALHHLTGILARRLGSRAITVNCIAPGPVRTDMTEALFDNAEADIVSATPLRRLAGPDDVAGALIFLTARAGASITGCVIPVDGGLAINTWGGDPE